MLSSAAPLDWAVFAGAVVFTMLLDGFLIGRSSGARVSFRAATLRSLLAIFVALCFAGFVYARMGSDKAVTYVVAYLVEESLSVDNLFVFLVIFSYFGIPEKHQQKTLFWGILGAVVMRLAFVLAGSALLHRFSWMMYVFGGFLVFTGAKLALKKDSESVDPESSLALRIARKYLRTTDQFDGANFFTVKDGVRYATPLLLVLIVVEFTDVVFAVDSVPAVLALSPDIFIVYTSNIFRDSGSALPVLHAGGHDEPLPLPGHRPRADFDVHRREDARHQVAPHPELGLPGRHRGCPLCGNRCFSLETAKPHPSSGRIELIHAELERHRRARERHPPPLDLSARTPRPRRSRPECSRLRELSRACWSKRMADAAGRPAGLHGIALRRDLLVCGQPVAREPGRSRSRRAPRTG